MVNKVFYITGRIMTRENLINKAVPLMILLFLIAMPRGLYRATLSKRAGEAGPSVQGRFPVEINLNQNCIIMHENREYIDLAFERGVHIQFIVPESAFLRFYIFGFNPETSRKLTNNPQFAFRISVRDELRRSKGLFLLNIDKSSMIIDRFVNLDLSEYYGQRLEIGITFYLIGPEHLLLQDNTSFDETLLITRPSIHSRLRTEEMRNEIISPIFPGKLNGHNSN